MDKISVREYFLFDILEIVMIVIGFVYFLFDASRFVLAVAVVNVVKRSLSLSQNITHHANERCFSSIFRQFYLLNRWKP